MIPKKLGFWKHTDYSFCNVKDCNKKKSCLRHTSNYIWSGNEVVSMLIPPHNNYICEMYWPVEKRNSA